MPSRLHCLPAARPARPAACMPGLVGARPAPPLDFQPAWLPGCASRNPCNGNKMSTGSLSITPTNKMNWVRKGGDRGAQPVRPSVGPQAFGQRARPLDSCPPRPCLPVLQVDIVNVWAGATATKDWSQASVGAREGRRREARNVADLTAEKMQVDSPLPLPLPQMLPIPCPKGFRTASYKDKGAILEPFL